MIEFEIVPFYHRQKEDLGRKLEIINYFVFLKNDFEIRGKKI